ncbi:MAG: dienelactone hydrolase family protein [Planctomycetes bacterium]|nr:dienelactone hydrolase family protein [Planctomycetota bacterium]
MALRFKLPILLMGILSMVNAEENARTLHSIPLLPKFDVDGDGAEWGEAGLRITAFAEDGSEPVDAGLLRAFARVGWTAHGIAVLVDVRSSAPWVESAAPRTGYENDSVELFLRQGSEWKKMIQPVLTPGLAPGHDELRSYVWDYRGAPAEWKDAPLAVEAARKRREDGYTLEALIPWAALRFEAKAGAECEFRININKRLPNLGRRQLVWRSAVGDEFQRLALSDKAGEAVDAAAWIRSEPTKGVCASVVAGEAAAGQRFQVMKGETELGSGVLRAKAGRAEGWLALPFDAADGSPMTVRLGGRVLGADKPAHPRESLRDQLLMSVRQPRGNREDGGAREVVPQVPFVFTAAELPQARIKNPQLAALAGITSVETRWFDDGFNEVQKAEKPGRYGAIITVKLEGAEPVTLYRTVWRLAAEPKAAGAALGLPEGAANDRELQSALGGASLSSLAENGELPRLLAALAEAKPGEAVRVGTREQLWWHTLRTKLGTQTRYEYFRLLPKGYDDNKEKRWPAILYLHGSGGRFPRDYAPLAKREPNRDLAGWALGKGDLPFVIYSLQSFGGWEPPAGIDALESILKEDRIDSDRVIIMGFSMGGMGTWNCAVDYPERWAAAVPLGGRGDRAGEVERVKNLPIWVFNGDKDESTTLADAKKIVEALTKSGGKLKFTVLEGAGHGETQNGAFETPGLWEWLAEQKREGK